MVPTLMRTCSPGASAATISANIFGMGSKFPGQLSSLCGQESHVAVCGSHSAGMRKPKDAGVVVTTGSPGVSRLVVEEAAGDRCVRVDPAVAEERPVRSRL